MIEARLRPSAEKDLVERTHYYRIEATEKIAEKFFKAALETLRLIEQMPTAGSLRIGETCGVPDLQSIRIDKFPYGWFYFVKLDHIDVVRLLSYSQNLPSLFNSDL